MKPLHRTGIVRDPRYAGHCTAPDQPECQQRLDAVCDMLDGHVLKDALQQITPQPVSRQALLRVHSGAHIRRMENTKGRPATYLDSDTSISPMSHDTALLAAGGLCQAIKLVHNNALDNAFALIRPPGHHAERSAAKGFCLYNNIAVGAKYAQHTLGLKRILIVDWDLHHGNGTQHCFEEDSTVLFFSTHRSFFYPGSGRLRDTGKGAGKGFTINIPLLPGFGDGDYLVLFERILKPIALEFDPDLILVSAGFDIHFKDPMGGMRVTPKGFAGLTRSLMDMADACCEGKLVMALEGGYDPGALSESVMEVLKEMSGLQTTDKSALLATADRKKTAGILWRVKQVHRKYWPCLTALPEGDSDAPPSLPDRFRSRLAQLTAYFKS